MRKSTINTLKSSTQEPKEELRINGKYIIDGFYRYNRIGRRCNREEKFDIE